MRWSISEGAMRGKGPDATQTRSEASGAAQGQRLLLWVVVAALGALAVLSAVGAFLGAERADKLFNSAPLVVYWFALTGMFLAGFVYFRRLIRSPAQLATHLGCLLVLAGAMYGSDRGHAVARSLLGIHKVPAGKMRIHEGQSSDVVFNDRWRRMAQLPFDIRLNDFWLEHYPPERDRWDLWVGIPPAGGAGQSRPHRHERIEWAEGRKVRVDAIEANIEVLRYIPHAALVYEQGATDRLEVVPAGGEPVTVPAEVGRQMRIEKPRTTLRITKRLESARVMRFHADGPVVEDPSGQGRPALRIEVFGPDQDKKVVHVFRDVRGHQRVPGVHLHYVSPEPIAAEPETASGVPAMRIRVRQDSQDTTRWLLPRNGEEAAQIRLGSPAAEHECTAEEHAETDGACCEGKAHAPAVLLFTPPHRQIRDYKSDLSVLVNGKEVAREVTEVNEPLHYGGYHFYQSGYDDRAGRFTILSVASDSGLLAVYAGFALLLTGVFWTFWLRPAWRFMRKRGAKDGT